MRANVKRRLERNREIAKKDSLGRCRFCKKAFEPGKPTFLVFESGLRYCNRDCWMDACGVKALEKIR